MAPPAAAAGMGGGASGSEEDRETGALKCGCGEKDLERLHRQRRVENPDLVSVNVSGMADTGRRVMNIIRMYGGLGNQMFQYAFYRNLLQRGRNVKADLSAYIKPGMMSFELCTVFPGIRLERCDPNKKERYLQEGHDRVYIEAPPRGQVKATFKSELLEMESGYIEGFHCSFRYPEMIRQELWEDFNFPYLQDRELCEWKKRLEEEETVAVHIRRGDFLAPKYCREIGNICTEEYYKKAIDYVRDCRPNARFCFFFQ